MMMIILLTRGWRQSGANMSEIIRFAPKSEHERVRLIREARAIYDSIFPPTGPVSEQRADASASRSDAIPLS
jgi:hypothetical protein